MPITIHINVAALKAQRRLGQSIGELRISFESLSTVLRIVRAKDDAAGLAIADSLKADSRIASVAIRDANDGVSLISIADGALDRFGSALTRLNTLQQASSSVLAQANQQPSLALSLLRG